jgi:hypothetical protein
LQRFIRNKDMLLLIVLSLVHLNAQIGIPFVPYAVIKMGNTLGSLHMVRVQVTGACLCDNLRGNLSCVSLVRLLSLLEKCYSSDPL